MNDISIEKLLRKYYNMDMHYEDGKILGSMYTKPPDIVLEAFFKFYQSNLGNAGLYPGSVEMEKEVIKFLLKLTSGKETFYGHVVSGGTEANIIALWAAREMGYRKILATEDVHFSVRKASKILNLPLINVGMVNGRMDVSSLESKLRDSAIVVATAGTTPLGFVDPIKEIGEICALNNCYLHVDAAFGGYVIPFLRELGYITKKFGFDINEVRSITIDPHKMGLAPYPAGGIVSRKNIFKEIAIEAPYLVDEKSDTLLGTRQSGSVAAAYVAHLYFGWKGYIDIVKSCMDMSFYLVKRAEEEYFQIFSKPEMNIVNIKIKNVKKIKRALRERGWGVSINPKYRTIRIVVMPHINEGIIDRFLEDLKNIKKDYGL